MSSMSTEENLLMQVRALSVRCAELEQQQNAAILKVRKLTANELDKLSTYVVGGGNDPTIILRLIERAKARLG